MKKQPKIGLVTVLYQSDDVLPGFFKSLSAQSFQDYHLYLIDNSPKADSREIIGDLHRQYPLAGYTYIANNSNMGVAHGNNQGILLSLAAGCTHTLLLNNDIEFEQEHLLQTMFAHALASGERMIVPKILFHDTRKIWMAGGRMLKLRGYTTHVGGLQDDAPPFNVARHFDYAPTCFMLIDNILFDEVGLMDPSYFVYFDDTDFVYRSGCKGHLVYYMPTLVVLHKESASTGGAQSSFFRYYFNRNRLYFIRKNYKGLHKWIALFVTTLAAIRNVVRYDRVNRSVLLRAFREGIRLPIHQTQYPKTDT